VTYLEVGTFSVEVDVQKFLKGDLPSEPLGMVNLSTRPPKGDLETSLGKNKLRVVFVSLPPSPYVSSASS
jgi:hypothetical protein